jgi:glycosyltransferase involved in cell wall biosynthesis
MTTQRPSREGEQSAFLDALSKSQIPVDIVSESFPGDPRVINEMRRVVLRRRPDIVETHDFKSHFLIRLVQMFGGLRGVRWIAYHHGYTRMSFRVRAYQKLDRYSLRFPDLIVTLCQPFRRQLEEAGIKGDRIQVIANAVEQQARPADADIEQLRSELGIDPEDVVLLSVGRLSAEKGHAELVRAFRKLRESGLSSRLRLLLVGDGGEFHRLREEAAELGTDVLFAGHRTDPWPFYSLADIFVLPSHTEGSPLVLFEAMSAGCAVVATHVGGIPEVATDGQSALLVPPHDSAALEVAIRRVLLDDALRLRLGKAARTAMESFTPQQYTERLLGIYQRVLSAG